MTIVNNHISIHDNVRPRLPFILNIIETGSKSNNTYFNSANTGYNVLIDLQFKWSENLNDEIRYSCQLIQECKKIFPLCVPTFYSIQVTS